MELLQLRYFLTVAKTLNISRAAEHHMIPQPAMSQTISRLERELGKPLFNRQKNKLSLTTEGQAFLQSVSTSMAELDSAIQAMQDTDGALKGEITLLVRQHRRTMVDCIVAFRRHFPDVSFRIFYSQNKNDSEDYDMCVSSIPPNESYNNSKCLITERLQLMVASSHSLASKEYVNFSDLRNEEFALLDKTSSLWNHTSHLCRQSGFEPRISMICGDLHCMTKYVSAGMAITLGPEISWRGIKDDSVVFVPQYRRKSVIRMYFGTIDKLVPNCTRYF